MNLRANTARFDRGRNQRMPGYGEEAMKRSSRKSWFALCALLLGCSSVVDFDRSKISQGDGDDAGVSMDATVDGRVPDAAAADTSQPDGSGAVCDTNAECEPTELCCAGSCQAASALEGCEACGIACEANSNSCRDRACVCGDGAACGGDTPHCRVVVEGEAARCTECRGDSDCADRTDGKEQCVAGACAACDAEDSSSGCANPMPVCDPASGTCLGCDTTRPCPSGMQCVSGACYGCDPTTNSGCAAGSSAPVCKAVPNMAGLFECVACTSNAECATNTNGALCVNGSCERCNPAGNLGCDPNSATPICDAVTQTCRACGRTGDCASPQQCSTNQSLPTYGRCVQCRDSNVCVSAGAPLCDNADGTCKSCALAGGDAACAAAGKGTCNESTGQCVVCTSDAQCSNNPGGLTRCDTTTNQCVGCVPGATPSHCAGTTPICDTTTRTCRGCTTATQATDCGGATPACGANGTCVLCNSTVGCMGATPYCLVNPTPSLNACVGCLNSSQCNDQNACTTDACNASNACTHDPIPVEDGLTCTTGACDPATGAITQTVSCPADDGVSCTAGAPTCTAQGCNYAVDPTSTVCTSDPCVTGSTCVGLGGAVGTGCSAGTPVACPGGAACVPGVGCPATPPPI